MSLTLVGRCLAVILFIGGLLHAYGSFLAFDKGSSAQVWSLGSAGFALFLAVLAFHGCRRPPDTGVLAITVGGLGLWFLTVVGFGLSIGAVADPRVLYHLIVSAALAVVLLLLRRAG